MINPKDIASLPFLKKSPYTGSFRGMRYRIQKEVVEELRKTVELLEAKAQEMDDKVSILKVE